MLQSSSRHGITSGAPIHPQLLVPNPPPVTLPTEEPKQHGSVSLKCDICQKIFNSESQAVQHFHGQKHKFRLQEIGGSETEMSASPVSNASQQRIDTSHSASAPGNNSLPLSFLSTKGSENKGLFCEPCRLKVNSQAQMDTHLQGAKHKNVVASM